MTLKFESNEYTNGTPVGIFTEIISFSFRSSRILTIALKELL